MVWSGYDDGTEVGKVKEKIYQLERNLRRNHKEYYERHQKNNENWKAKKKISSALFFQKNKEYIYIRKKLKRRFGFSVGINEIKKDIELFKKMISEVSC